MFDREPWDQPVYMPEIKPPVERRFEDFVYIVRNGRAEIVGYTGTWATLRIPHELEGYPVESVASGAFMGNEYIQDVVVSGTVRRIGNHAFYRCPALRMVAILEGVESIGHGAFFGCSLIERVFTPSSIRSVGDDAFMDTARLRIMGSPESAMQDYCDRNGIYLMPIDGG